MDISRDKININFFSEVTDFTANIANQKYSLCQYSLSVDSLSNQPVHAIFLTNATISLLVIAGSLHVQHEVWGEYEYTVGEGAHFFQGSVFQIKTATRACTFLIASAERNSFSLTNTTQTHSSQAPLALSSYLVHKPWGWERWYTHNLSESLPYTLKLIYMNRGMQSSLQSHQAKSETNYILEGKAEVLHGLNAPNDLSAPIQISLLKSKIYGPGEGWSNVVGELHRVIAIESYKAVEISTPELDDVIRWQDDSARTHGRIESEHTSLGERI